MSSPKRPRLLLTEDEPVIAMHLAVELEDRGFEVTIVHTLEDARIALTTSDIRFEAIVTDIRLPDGNGAELVVQARALQPAVPIVICTGLTADAIDLVPPLPREQIVTKPCSADQLVAALRYAGVWV